MALVCVTLLIAACQSNAALDGAASSTTSSKRAKAQPAAPILSSDPAAFIGLDDDTLSNALGKPKQVRKDAPAEIWQYFSADCVVDFYLYDGEEGLTVAYLEARNATADTTPTDRCVKSLMQSVSADGAPRKVL